MKTKQQILERLKAQEWYGTFKQETERENRKSVEEYVEDSRRYLGIIILGAFEWNRTRGGRYFWAAANKEYLKFLYDEQD